MKYKIDGDLLQTLTIELEDSESVYSESGSMVWMTDNLEMQSEMKGGIMGGIGRMFSGESLFLINYTSKGGKGFVTFANEVPGKILIFKLKENESIICQRDTFLCAEQTVKLKTFFRRKLGVGLFGGEGFILQEVTGPGTAFVTLDGEINEVDLKDGQRLKVDTGCVGIIEPKVKFDIQMIKGIKNILFGGEGLFLATLDGPGKVWLQSMPISTLAGKISQYIRTK